jgi:hypothetical protein
MQRATSTPSRERKIRRCIVAELDVPATPKRSPKPGDVWCAFKPDGSDFVLFGRELTALRYATQNGMLCRAVAYGKSLKEQTSGDTHE